MSELPEVRIDQVKFEVLDCNLTACKPVSSFCLLTGGKEKSILPSQLRPNPKGKKEGVYYGWIVLLVLFVIGVISLGLHFSFTVFFKSLQEDFGWGRASTSAHWSMLPVFAHESRRSSVV